jgi:hypothetical protein
VRIADVLREEYACVIDGHGGVVRVWTKLPEDGRTVQAIRRKFPAAERYGSFWRLGGYADFASAISHFTQAKLSSAACQRLHTVMIHDSALAQG